MTASIRRTGYFFLLVILVPAMAGPEVPHKMTLGDMVLTIRDDARANIQKDVDALTRVPKYFDIKIERARIYLPVVEQIFREEQIPVELMFLALQESDLIPDAVSTSNAVGFWQFKAETAKDFNLVVNEQVDERMNIASASRAAARYLKKSYTFLNNWVLVVQSYYMGIGGTRRSARPEHLGLSHMEITMETFWYVRRYLAHKVAFEESWRGTPTVPLAVLEVSNGTDLHRVSKDAGVDHELLKSYNLWARTGVVPADRTYHVLVPGGKLPAAQTPPVAANRRRQSAASEVAAGGFLTVNGLLAIRARQGESLASLAGRAGVSYSRLLKWNDCSPDRKPQVNEIFYLQRKGRSTSAGSHVLAAGESLWTVSQKYGIRLSRLKKFNAGIAASPAPGTVILLAAGGDAGMAKRAVRLDPSSVFEWGTRQ